MIKKQLSEVQQFAISVANDKVLIAQNKRNDIAIAIGKELNISTEELPKWKFAEDFSYIELPEKKK